MKKTLVLIGCLFLFPMVLLGVGGSGGPIGIVYMSNLDSLDEYFTSQNIQFDDNIMIWGGSGSNLLTDKFGIGGTIAGGFQFNKDSDYGALYFVTGILTMENMLFESKIFQISALYGPGYTLLDLVLNSGNQRVEFATGGMSFLVAVGIQLKLAEVTRLEIDIGYNIVTGTTEWRKISGPESSIIPPTANLSGAYVALLLRFGGVSSP